MNRAQHTCVSCCMRARVSVTCAIRRALNKRGQHFDRSNVLGVLGKAILDLASHPVLHLQDKDPDSPISHRASTVQHTHTPPSPPSPPATAPSRAGILTVFRQSVANARRDGKLLLLPWRRLFHCRSLTGGIGRRCLGPSDGLPYGGDGHT